ncbi:C-type natriuretic peptide-like [Vipera latastei]
MPALRANPARQANAARRNAPAAKRPARLGSAPFGSAVRAFEDSLSLSLARSCPVALPAPAQPGMLVSRPAASGLLLLSLLALSLDGKPLQQKWLGPQIPPLPQKWRGPLQPEAPPLMQPHQLSAGGTTAWRKELSPRAEAASGPAAAAPAAAGGGGSSSKAAVALPKPPKAKGASSSASRLMRDLRTDGKQARQKWGRMVHHEQQRGGDGGGSRRQKGLPKKGGANGCFGLKIDRIGSMSGLGC